MKAPDWIEDFNAQRGQISPIPPPLGAFRYRVRPPLPPLDEEGPFLTKSLGFFLRLLGAVYGAGFLAGTLVHWLRS